MQLKTDDMADEVLEQPPGEVLSRLSGRTIVEISNPWFCNQKFGFWDSRVLCSIEKVTEDAYLLSRVVPGEGPIGRIEVGQEKARDNEEIGVELLESRFIKAVEDAWGEPRQRAKEGWIPKSAVGRVFTHDGPEFFRVFAPEGWHGARTLPHDADIVVREHIIVNGKRRRYKKLAVDCGYDAGQDIKELAWEEFHPSAEYQGDQFLCWTVDDEPVSFAKAMVEKGYSIAVKKTLVE